MTAEQIAIIISMMITIPLLGLSVIVVVEWGGYLLRRPAQEMKPQDWLVLGIMFSFAGSIGDNIYWGMAWLTRFYEMSQSEWLFDNGVFSNIIFRQGFKIFACHCHIYAAVLAGTLALSAYRRELILLCLIGIILGGIMIVSALHPQVPPYPDMERKERDNVKAVDTDASLLFWHAIMQ